MIRPDNGNRNAGLPDGKSAAAHRGACRRLNAMYPKVQLLPHRLIGGESPLYTSGGRTLNEGHISLRT